MGAQKAGARGVNNRRIRAPERAPPCGARNWDFSRITGTGRIGVSCRPPIAYSRVDTGRNPSAVPSNSNFPASHLGSQLGLIAQSYRAFSSPPRGRPRRLPGQAAFCRRRRQPRRPPLAKIRPGMPAPTTGPGTSVAVEKVVPMAIPSAFKIPV